MNKNVQAVLAVTILAAVIGIVWQLWPRPYRVPHESDAFAKCLTARGAVMYGADWCPHCQEEKAAFGAAFRFINYVECPAEPKRCLDAGVQSYPTWIFPASPAGGPDGQKLVGRQGLTRLAEASDCLIPSDDND